MMFKALPITLAAAAALMACNVSNVSNTSAIDPVGPNTLSREEKREGWTLLFDGQSTSGWHTYGKPGTIGKAWKVEDGTLRLDASAKKEWQTAEGGDIVTDAEFEDFHLMLDWKLAPKGNSGVMFYVQETPQYEYPWYTGPEMQVLDNAGHSDASIHKHRAGDLYDLIASKEVVKAAGEWNTAEIISKDGKLTFRLNGEETLSTNMWDDNWRTMIAGSKFKDMKGFGSFKKGKISLQDHGDNVWYRNIKIRPL